MCEVQRQKSSNNMCLRKTKVNELIQPNDRLSTNPNLAFLNNFCFFFVFNNDNDCGSRLGKKQTISHDTKAITTEVKIDDRIQKLYKQQALVSIKSHKENFLNNPNTDCTIHPKIKSVLSAKPL